MKGWFLVERADGTEYFVCKKCGHSADVPYDRCPECEGEETMNNKAHLRPKDFDSNGDIIPTIDDFPMEIVAGKCPIEADGNCPLKQQGEWVRKEDIIHLLERWSDGYSYIEIPTETAIKAIKELEGGTEE